MNNIKKYCLTLDLKNDPLLIEEYKHWHKPENIWKEIVEGIKQIGIIDMEIFLHDTRMFMIMETPENFDWEDQMKKLSELPRQQEWEDFMSKFQQALPDTPEGEKWQMMNKIFDLNNC